MTVRLVLYGAGDDYETRTIARVRRVFVSLDAVTIEGDEGATTIELIDVVSIEVER